MMKLIIAIVANEDTPVLMKELIKHRYFVTKLASTGGLLRKGNTTLMIGAKEQDTDTILHLIHEFSRTRNELVPSSIINDYGVMPSMPLEVTVGGATVFILNVEKFEKM